MSNSKEQKKPLGRPKKYHTPEELRQANREKMAKYRRKHPERKEAEREWQRKRYQENKKLREMYLRPEHKEAEREWQRKRYQENKKLREMYLHTITKTNSS